MAKTTEILDIFLGDDDFPVEWENDEEKKLFWFFDDNHVPNPISPMYWSLNGLNGISMQYVCRRFGIPHARAWIGKRINGYLFLAVVPRGDESAVALKSYYEWIMPIYASNFTHWWENRYLPEILRNFAYIDNYPTESCSLQELMMFLEEAIDIQNRHFLEIHWILNMAQFHASVNLQEVAKEVVGDVDPSVIGRILISIKDRNWDSLAALWKLKEEIKEQIELGNIFETSLSTEDLYQSLKATRYGAAFLDNVAAYCREYGYRSSMYSHEYTNKLWVEDPTPVLKLLKDYLDCDYNYPVEYHKVVDDHQLAINQLISLIPSNASLPQKEKLKEAVDLAINTMHLTPDHHFYIDQGTFARMRLVLLAIGRRMVCDGLLSNPEDIMFLEYEQLRGYVAHPKSQNNLQGFDGLKIIGEAKRLYNKAMKMPPRDWVGTITNWSMYIEPYHTQWGWPERWERTKGHKVVSEKIVQGLPAASGIAEGIARVVTNTEDFSEVKNGEILICVMTNPAWMVLFSKIRAAVTDTGGVLSHTAVVAREFGIPAVVGTGDATKRIKTGDKVIVNGNTGLVQIAN